MTQKTVEAARKSAGFSQLTSVATATSVAAPKEATKAIIQCTGQNIRWRDDGVAPTATIGMQLANGASIEFTGNLQALQVIQEAASAVVNISFYV